MGFDSRLFKIARTLVRASVEKEKPNIQRLPEFRDSSKSSLELKLFSKAPIYNDVEVMSLTHSLTYLAGKLGADHLLMKKVLEGKSPQERARELVYGTCLGDVQFRKEIYSGINTKARTQDPMLRLAELVDPMARKARAIQNEADEMQKQAHAKIARAKYQMSNEERYPDATSTLRLSYGTVDGYSQDGKAIPAFSTLGGFYARSSENMGHEPFHLSERWIEKKSRLNLDTPFNFVCTAEVVGGNSGSPVVDRAGEFVGIIFDNNMQGLACSFAYAGGEARSIAVDSKAILEALNRVYEVPELVKELIGPQSSSTQ
jgi:hypothetical protein